MPRRLWPLHNVKIPCLIYNRFPPPFSLSLSLSHTHILYIHTCSQINKTSSVYFRCHPHCYYSNKSTIILYYKHHTMKKSQVIAPLLLLCMLFHCFTVCSSVYRVFIRRCELVSYFEGTQYFDAVKGNWIIDNGVYQLTKSVRLASLVLSLLENTPSPALTPDALCIHS